MEIKNISTHAPPPSPLPPPRPANSLFSSNLLKGVPDSFIEIRAVLFDSSCFSTFTIEIDAGSITNFWKSIPTERFARLRFMELAPGGHIAPHNDSPNGVRNTDFDMMDHMIPINVAIVHPDDCYMTLDGHGTVPFAEGKAIIVNITNTHYVVNNSSSTRMHMIAHCVIGNKKKEFAELVVRSYNKQYECGKISTI